MTLIDIFHMVLILSAFSLCIFVFVYLKRFFEMVEAVREDIHQFVENTIPVLNNLEEVTQRANRIVTEIEGYWEEINRSIRTLRQKILNLRSWNKFSDSQNQTSEFIKTFRSVAKGISVFWSEYKHK